MRTRKTLVGILLGVSATLLICQCLARAACAKGECEDIWAAGFSFMNACAGQQSCTDQKCMTPIAECAMCNGTAWCDALDKTTKCCAVSGKFYWVDCTSCTFNHCPDKLATEIQEVDCSGVGTAGTKQLDLVNCKLPDTNGKCPK